MSASEIISQLKNGQYECICCHEIISNLTGAVWSCTRCFCLLHRGCAKQWAEQHQKATAVIAISPSSSAAAAAAAQSSSVFSCPACRAMGSFGSSLDPVCYCGKTTFDSTSRPDGLLLPGSCGELCLRLRSFAPACPHPCQLQCHPGRCEPCELVREMQCFCGRHPARRVKCGSEPESIFFSCDQICGFVFSCGCVCERKCHARHSEGESCGRTIEKKCGCGKGTISFPCGSAASAADPRCENVCGKPLACGFHLCPRVCCSNNECLGGKPCLLSPDSLSPDIVCSCGAGRKVVDIVSSSSSSGCRRSSCRDPLPGCGASCGKKCAAGEHICSSPCHEQTFPSDPFCFSVDFAARASCAAAACCPSPCTEKVKISCRCGKEKSIETRCFVRRADTSGAAAAAAKSLCKQLGIDASLVADPKFLCDTPCRRPLNCGNPKHFCEEMCCAKTAQEHDCTKICTKLRNCKKHRCERPCHSKSVCPPCSVILSFEEIRCHCGRSVIDPPIRCGQAGGTAVLPYPACNQPCVRQRPCGHGGKKKSGAAAAAAAGGSTHACHSDAVACPACTVPVLPACAVCGEKKVAWKVPCWKAASMPCPKGCGKQ